MQILQKTQGKRFANGSGEFLSDLSALSRSVAAATKTPLTENAQTARKPETSAYSSRCPRLPRRLLFRSLQCLEAFLLERRFTAHLDNHWRQQLVLEALANLLTDLVRVIMDFRYLHLRARIIRLPMTGARLGDDDRVQRMTTDRVFRLRTCTPTRTLVEDLRHPRRAVRRLLTNTLEAENMTPGELLHLNETAQEGRRRQPVAREGTP